jgi:hypothetical protein
VIGLAAGTMAFGVAVAGTAVFSLIALYLGRVSFGFRNYFDGLLRFTMAGADAAAQAAAALNAHCSRFALTVVQQVPHAQATEHVYQIRFRRQGSQHQLVQDLEAIAGVSNLSLLLEETRVEV